MPNNWKTYNLFDFIDINPRMKFNSSEEYPFVEMKDLNPNSRKVLPSATKKLKGGAKFQNGDTLFARITPCLQNGKICQVKGLKNNKGFGSTEFLVFRGKENISDNDFVYYLSREPFVRQFAESNMIGTSGRQRIAKEAFQNLKLELPPLPEQKAIANILSAIDDKIENNLAINKTLEDMAMALYKHWFVDFGPFQDGEFVDSELGMIPKGWVVKSIGELYNTSSGGTPSRKKMEYYENGSIPWIKSKELNNSFIIETEEKITEEALSKSSAKLFPKKSVLMAMYGATVGEVGINSIESTCNQAICAIKEKELPYFYVFLYLKYEKENILNQAVGSAQQNISQVIIKNLSIINPLKTDVIGLFKKLENNYKILENNIKENRTLTKLRDTLLPKLISGEVRLKEFRGQIENVITNAVK
ncbi:restriction endonuclease subunit S [Xanthomarina gelatinilytica]|uniref:restriction endonuclease subunit S n=1 Tax=Xanthomarina gelatinilytica TaxID=1137281 RepID=UPI003AA95BB1